MFWLYFLIASVLIGLIIIIFLIKNRNSNQRKVSYRERIKIESGFETLTAAIDQPKKTITPGAKKVQPALMVNQPKDFKVEIFRFKNYSLPDNEKFNEAIKSAITKLAGKDYSGALIELDNAADAEAFNYRAIYCRGLLKCVLKDYTDAIDDFTETIRLEMDEKNALYFRGLAYYELKDYHSAEMDFNSFATAYPKFTESYFYLGMICSAQERLDEAVNYFSKIIGIDPNNGKAYLERALIKFKKGEKESCCKDLKLAMNFGILEAYHYIKENCNDNTVQRN